MRRFSALCLLTGCIFSTALRAAEFQDGQAARAVIGQPSFSAHEKGPVARALSLAKGSLYVAELSGRVLSYDLSRLGAVKTPGCPVCLVTPQSSVTQNVFEGVAAVAVYGPKVVIADARSRRVLIWRGVSPLQKPDVVLNGFLNPVSVAIDNRRLFVGDAGSHHVFVWNSLPTSDGQPPDVTLGVAEPGDNPGADSIEVPAAIVSDGVTLYVADSALRRVLVFSPADSSMPQVRNAASHASGPLAPGTLAAIDHVAGVTSAVFLNGNAIRIIETTADQIQVQVPYELNGMAGSLWIKTELSDGSIVTTRPTALRFTSVSPAIFALGIKEPRTGLVLRAPEGFPLSPENPAKAGELLIVWATGLGAISTDANSEGAFETVTPVRATLNGNFLEVVSAALPAEATGVYEVRVRLPARLVAGASLVLLQNDARSNAVIFPVQPNYN